MEQPLSFAQSEFAWKKKTTLRERFLGQMELVVLWARLVALIMPHYPESRRGRPHIGPVAQDFHAAFSVGMDDKHISMVNADGVALAAIQGLNQRLHDELSRRDADNTELKKQNETLTSRLDALEKLFRSLARENGKERKKAPVDGPARMSRVESRIQPSPVVPSRSRG